MGRQKKNELDAILEQLKKSYATDDVDNIDNSLLEEEETDKDTELASALEKIFASNEIKGEEIIISEDDVQDFISDINITEDNEKSDSLIDEDALSVVINQENVESVSSITHDIDDEEAFDDDTDTLISEEELVDNVLSAMLKLEERDDNEVIVDEKSVDNEEIIPSCDECMEEIAVESGVNVDVESCIQEAVDDDQDQTNNVTEQFPTIDKIRSSEEDRACDEEDDEGADNNELDLVTDVIAELNDEIDEFDTLSEANDTGVSEELSKATTDEYDYTFDELQSDLRSMSFYKPEKDLSKVYIDKQDENSTSITDVQAHNTTNKIGESDTDTAELHDISLLMKFGYGTDSGLGIRKESFREVVVEKNKEYTPGNKRIIHGFIGKEFAEASQREAIMKKFKRDRIHLLIMSIIVSMLSVTMCTIDGFSAKMILAEDYIRTLIIGIAALILVSVILGKRLYLGILSVLRYEHNPYSWIAFIHIVYILYSVFAIILIEKSMPYHIGIPYFSLCGYVLICTSLTVWAEYIDCYREMNTFEFISSDHDHFVAEKELGNCHSTDKSKSDISYRYSIRRTGIVSGFFKRASDNSARKVNNVMAMSILFAVSILIGISASIITDSAINGAHSAILILISSTQLSFAIVPSLIYYLNCMVLRRKNSAFVSSDSAYEYTKIDSLTFNDTEALEVVSITEINPGNESDNPKKWSNMANNVFIALGGPVSEFLLRDQTSNVDHDLIINSITENGIDLYFDSSVNVLIGDAQYMLYHNIRVRTDIKLTTAVRGADRTVIYVAFDGVPRAGYIITSKIKVQFVDMLKMLSSHGIKASLNSYEPEVNEGYFELNKIDISLDVNKPNLYEDIRRADAVDSGVVSDTNSGVCLALLYGSKMIRDNKRNKISKIIQSVICFLSSITLISLCYIFSMITHTGMMLLFYLTSVLVLIPNMVQVIEILRRK